MSGSSLVGGRSRLAEDLSLPRIEGSHQVGATTAYRARHEHANGQVEPNRRLPSAIFTPGGPWWTRSSPGLCVAPPDHPGVTAAIKVSRISSGIGGRSAGLNKVSV